MRTSSPLNFCLLCATVLAASACDGGNATSPDRDAGGLPDSGIPEGPQQCTRFQEKLGESCVDVNVVGVDAVPYDFERAGYTLRGTLTLPLTYGDYRAPLFVLTHGSGPNDRDETSDGSLGVGYGQNVPLFRLLAEALAQRGIAVYRYDKRTCFAENSEGRCPAAIGDYPGSLDDVRVDDYIADFRAAVRAVSTHPKIASNDVTVVGHSQGGNFVPLLVVDEPGVVAGVQLAAASLPVDEVIPRQLRDLADFLQSLGAQFAEDVADLRAQADAEEAALSQIRAGTYPQDRYQGIVVEYWKRWIESTSHLRDEFLAADDPILLLNGDIDFNVAPHHLERFRSWATEGGKTNAKFVVLPEVTHQFVKLARDGASIEALLSPEAVDEIVNWHRSLAP